MVYGHQELHLFNGDQRHEETHFANAYERARGWELYSYVLRLLFRRSLPCFFGRATLQGCGHIPVRHSGLHPASQSFCDEEAWIADWIFRALEVENEIRPNTGP